MLTPVRKLWTPPDWRVLTLVCVFLLVANVFDAYHTQQLLGIHAQEVNPLMRHLMERDQSIVWALKIGVPLLLGCASAFVILHPRAPAFWRRSLWYALCLTTAFYAFIVANLISIYVRILCPALG